MNLHQRGTELINGLKDHLVEVLCGHPDAEPGGTGFCRKKSLVGLGYIAWAQGNWITPVVRCCGC